MSSSEILTQLLSNNAEWAAEVTTKDPHFHEDQARGPQEPNALWIGCSDSQAPAAVITKSNPGDLFVHTNIANQFHLNDNNAQSVLTYAIQELHVEQVIIVGHTHCSGVEAALTAVRRVPSLHQGEPIAIFQNLPNAAYTADRPINQWLIPLTNLAISLDLSKAPDNEAAEMLLVEENVKAQVLNVCQTWSIQQAWNDGRSVLIHGWVHDVTTGRLRDLAVTVGPAGNESLFAQNIKPGYNGWHRIASRPSAEGVLAPADLGTYNGWTRGAQLSVASKL